MKKYFSIFLLIMFLYIPSVVYGDELGFAFSVDATQTAVSSAGKDVIIKISVNPSNAEQKITKCDFTVNPTGDVQIVSVTEANKWSSVEGQQYSFVLSNPETDDGSGVVANATVKVNGTGKVTISNITCSTADNVSGTASDETVSFRVTSGPIIKVDGVIKTGGEVVLASGKSSFVLSVTSENEADLNGVVVKALSTSGGDKIVCDSSSSSLSNCTIQFAPENFCVSDTVCTNLYSEFGDVIKLKIEGLNREIFIHSVVSDEDRFEDSSISRLNVFGQEISLIIGEDDYSVTVPINQTEYKVIAELSDPEHYMWDTEDNPSKYTYAAETVTLIVKPKNDRMLGANTKNYIIHVTFEGDSSSGSESSESSSGPSIQPTSSVRPSSSSMVNPQTGGLATFFVALILFGSLIISLKTYSKNME